MSYRVQVSPLVREAIEERFAEERSPDGAPSRSDFESGPLTAATLLFEHFDELSEEIGPSIRHCHVLFPGFTPIVFVGVLVGADSVEIAGFDDDPDYWDLIENDPDD